MLPHRQIKMAAALALALGASCTPAASAHLLAPDPPQGAQTPSNVTPIVRVIAPSGGFDWGDAAIGAAGGFALSMLGLGGALTLSERRGTRPKRPSAIRG
jgi:hypothetical protein